MNEHGAGGASDHRWYARPVLFVADLNRSLDFYLDQLGLFHRLRLFAHCRRATR